MDVEQRFTFTANQALSECSMVEIDSNGNCAVKTGSTTEDCNKIPGNVAERRKCEIKIPTTSFEGIVYAVKRHLNVQTNHSK